MLNSVRAPGGTAGQRWAPVVAVLAAVVVLILAIASGAGDSKTAVVLPLALGAGLLMGLLALSRFHAFLLIILVLRSSLDMAKLSGSDGGSRALDPSSLLSVLFLMVGFLWLAGRYRSLGGLPGSRLRIAFAVFLAACVLSVVGSGNIGSSALEAMRIASVVMMFVVVEQVCSTVGETKRVLAAAFLSTVFPLALTFFGLLTGHARGEQKAGFTRIMGTFNQSNEFGRYLMLMIIMGVAIYPCLGRRARRPLAIVLTGAGLCLVPTYTRSALVAGVLGLLVVGMVHNKRIVLGVVAVAGIALLAVPSVSARFADLSGGGSSSTATPSQESSLDWRFEYWRQVLPLANDNPVTGVGLSQVQHLTADGQPPHNDYLRAYVETGVLGLCAYLWLLGTLVATGRRALKVAPRGSFDRGVAAGFLGCAVAWVAASAVANMFSNVVTLWYFAAFAAAATAALRRHTGSGARVLDAAAVREFSVQ